MFGNTMLSESPCLAALADPLQPTREYVYICISLRSLYRSWSVSLPPSLKNREKEKRKKINLEMHVILMVLIVWPFWRPL